MSTANRPLDSTLEEKHRHALHAENDDRCEVCVEDARHREASKTRENRVVCIRLHKCHVQAS